VPLVSVEQLVDLAEQRHRDPNEVLRRARESLARAGTPEVSAAARWVLGLALHELGRLPEAIESYLASIETSVRYGLRDSEAQARAGLAISLMNGGDAGGAAEQIAMARAAATPATQGVVEMLYGLVLQRTGRLAEAQVVYSQSLRRLQETGEVTSVARLRLNRGILRAYQGDSEGAVEDLVVAEQIAAQQRLPVLRAMAAHNLGFAHGRRGDLPRALTCFVQAEQAYAALDRPGPQMAVLEADRCEVLLIAGLVAEAREAAQKAVGAVALTGDVAYLTECRLLLARSLLAGGAYREADEEASAVAAVFREAGRLPWAAMADYVAVQAEVLAAQDQVLPPLGLLDRCRDVALQLERQGWSVEAVHVRTFMGRVALALHQPALARAELGQAVMARRWGTADLRARAWHAYALLLLAEGDRSGAKRALSQGLRVVEEHLTSLGATELRARAAGHGSELARLGTRLALEERRPSALLCWAERWRANSLRFPPARPPEDDRLVADLAELRRVRWQLRASALDGAPTEHLQRVAVSIESTVRRRLLGCRGRRSHSCRLDLARLRRALEHRALVEYIGLEGWLYAVTVTRSRSRLTELAPLEVVERELAHLTFAVRRALRGRDATDHVAAGASRLDDMLLAPLRLPEGTAVVVVPTGALHRLPWGCLPSLAGRDVTVAPSAALWAQRPASAEVEGAAPLRVTLVAGPGLPGADAEVRQLAALYPGARLLTGPDATAASVLDGLGRSDLVHLAAHGHFRADSPLFSSVLLSDGPLTVHDLERAPQTAATVVLASCNAGLSRIESGDELIGTAATLLGLGVRSVVAPVVGVPDMPTASFMVSLHRGLIAGLPASAALLAARSGKELGVASVFLCIGRDSEVMGCRTTR
jgi:CHAT domain-containing protein/tetratricopeptide (TPR) repeat protein